jgi:hypothetical protein
MNCAKSAAFAPAICAMTKASTRQVCCVLAPYYGSSSKWKMPLKLEIIMCVIFRALLHFVKIVFCQKFYKNAVLSLFEGAQIRILGSRKEEKEGTMRCFNPSGHHDSPSIHSILYIVFVMTWALGPKIRTQAPRYAPWAPSNRDGTNNFNLPLSYCVANYLLLFSSTVFKQTKLQLQAFLCSAEEHI